MRRKSILAAVVCFIAAMMTCFFVGCGDGDKMTISIANKAELTAKWVVGEADRSVEIALKPDTYTLANTNVTASTSDADVIAVDGMKLTAKSGGTATITVNAGVASDSVEITVTPALKSLSITNKSDLGKAWILGQADREIAIAFAPDNYNLENSGVEIKSSDEAVVSVSGSTLHAVNTGVATITVSAKGLTDSVDLTVVPALEKFEVTNKTALGEIWGAGTERLIIPSFAPDLYTAANVTPIIACEPAELVEVTADWTIRAKQAGNGTITVTVMDKTDTFDVTIEHVAPSLVLGGDGVTETKSGDYEMSAMQGEIMTLPTISSVTTDGVDLAANVTMDFSDRDALNIDGNSMKPEIGEHIITYTAVNPADVTKIVRKTLKINVYRKIVDFQDGSFTVANERAANDQQTITNSNAGYTYARFNTAPSSVYYAEVTFKSTSTNNVWIGLSNMIKGNTDKFAVSAMTLKDTNCNSGEFYTSGNNSWNITTANAGYPLFQSWQLKGYRNFSIDTAGEITYATARDGDYIYYFVNGVYVNGYTLKDYRENDTIPGIFGHNLQPVTMSKIDYYSGDKARNKIDALLAGGKNIISQYLIYTENLSNDANSYGENENRFFKVNDVTSERGVNFDYTDKTNAGNNVRAFVSPYIHFDGDFSFEYEYKATDWDKADGKEHRSNVRIRNWYSYGGDRKDLFWVCAQVASGSQEAKVVLKNKAYKDTAAEWARLKTAAGEDLDASTGVRVKIVRKLYADKAEYTITITSLADENKTAVQTVTVTAAEDTQWDKPVQIFWDNVLTAGQYSNIRWQAE